MFWLTFSFYKQSFFTLRVPDKMCKTNISRNCLRYFYTKSYFWPLVRIVSVNDSNKRSHVGFSAEIGIIEIKIHILSHYLEICHLVILSSISILRKRGRRRSDTPVAKVITPVRRSTRRSLKLLPGSLRDDKETFSCLAEVDEADRDKFLFQPNLALDGLLAESEQGVEPQQKVQEQDSENWLFACR